MVFSSLVFLFTFLPITLVVYYLAPWKIKNIVLLIASLVFYAWGEPVYIILMLLSITFNYFMGRDIDFNQDEPVKKKRSLILAIVVNIFILGFFKYYVFLVQTINSILSINIPYRELALPIGISFYTFQTLSYIIDVYMGKVKVQKNIFNFGLYVSLFPQLIAGPIIKYIDVANQIEHRKLSIDSFGVGTMYFIRGLAKKVLLANNIGLLHTAIIGMEFSEISVLTAWLGGIAYTLQIYFDFGGYSDMAIGLGRMLGFNFMKNFDYPYISKSITEFWHRWHISLSTWFKEYVYIPLGGNKVSVPRHIINIMIVWFLTGLWHGASWNFVVWGLYYGVLLLIEKYILGKYIGKMPQVLQHIYLVVIVIIGWVFFFSPDMGYAARYIGCMFDVGGAGFINKSAVYYFLTNIILILICAIGSTPYVHRLFKILVFKTKKKHIWSAVVIYGILFLIVIAYLVSATYNPFLYFRF
ncbi:MBOAT family O-acyltransferase [Frisingicoccus sp.]|uniref:MBOAT family O-acyltransferase n=1 Tax=Frisingicoccus sp. TaxID=1918627 RepID=UPI003994152D